MSEELSQISPKSIGKFEFYKLGASTLNQLKDNNVFKQQVPEEFKRRKPDGLIINDKEIKGFVEYKQNKYLQTEEQISKIVSDWKEVAKSFCNLLIISSGIKTFWINTKNGKSIIGKDGSEINLLFDVKTIQNDSVTHEQTKLIEQIINQINNVITFDNNSLQSKNEANLIPLAKTMWQKLWVQSNNIPEKCLYNVVELFVFKFLSDLDVLNSHCNFQQVLSIRNNNCNESALNYYARNSRPEIQKLFPSGNDDTSIINGTVFVDENGDANKSYSQLFSELLDCLNEFENKQGSFRKIDHNFKTRLYELFLRQSAGVKRWGQYFTPRKVVKAMIKMINNTSFHENSRICDPFCGVGGFLLELIAEKSELRSQFNPLNGRVNPKIQLIGYDKGTDEKEDERTIILAKANMLIYFSDLISDYHDESFLKEFTNNAINKVFHLLRSNIGTFGKIDDEEYDLIITNPPYVTSGSKSLKDAIKSEGKQKFYEEVNGTGTESLAITWIIKKLKPNGQALVVVPDGLLKQISVLKYIRDRCFIKAIISLPQKTFYATSKKTYIMSLLKKRNLEQQTKPIFTYLVTETGESRDTYRFDIPKNDLTEMANLYNIYLNISQDDFKNLGGGGTKCKLIPYDEFETFTNWKIDHLWSIEEKINLGIKTSINEVSSDVYLNFLKKKKSIFNNLTSEFINGPIDKFNHYNNIQTKNIRLDNSKYFEFLSSISTGWTNTDLYKLNTQNEQNFPVYSAKKNPIAFVSESDPKLINCSDKCKLFSFASNGSSSGSNFVIHERPFYVSNDRVVIKVKNDEVLVEWLKYGLRNMRYEYDFAWEEKANIKSIKAKEVTVSIPVDNNNLGDIEKQKLIIKTYYSINELKEKVEIISKELKSLDLDFKLNDRV